MNVRKGSLALVTALSIVAAAAAASPAGGAPKKHAVAPSKSGSLVVALCDGKTQIEVPGKKPGDKLTRAEAQAVSDQLMREWKQKNPNAFWDAEKKLVAQATPQPGGAASNTSSHGASGPAPNKPPPRSAAPPSSGAPVQAQIYGAFTTRDERIWAASTQAFIETGNKIFHDAGQLGGTIGVSCDMCHPDASNTHPETYPKYQVQLGRVALLRDMINWCIENPVRGKPLADDDPKLKAIEAYVLSKRKGVPLDYGKH